MAVGLAPHDAGAVRVTAGRAGLPPGQRCTWPPQPLTAPDCCGAATELWLATGDDAYRSDLLDSPSQLVDAFDSAGFDFDRVTAPARLDLALNSGFDRHEQVVMSVLDGADRTASTRLPLRFPPAGPAAAVLLSRRAHLRSDQRCLHPLERTPGLDRHLPRRPEGVRYRAGSAEAHSDRGKVSVSPMAWWGFGVR
ncbi:MAG TPA: hypothetical protein VF635_06745 [Propionibacteriaceae bacterium]